MHDINDWEIGTTIDRSPSGPHIVTLPLRKIVVSGNLHGQDNPGSEAKLPPSLLLCKIAEFLPGFLGRVDKELERIWLTEFQIFFASIGTPEHCNLLFRSNSF